MTFHFLYGVPQRLPICVFRWGVRWKENAFCQDFTGFIAVVFCLQVVLAEKLFAALIGGSGNSRLPFASLPDGYRKMRARDSISPPVGWDNMSHPVELGSRFTGAGHSPVICLQIQNVTVICSDGHHASQNGISTVSVYNCALFHRVSPYCSSFASFIIIFKSSSTSGIRKALLRISCT